MTHDMARMIISAVPAWDISAPPGWESAIAKLARERRRSWSDLAEELRKAAGK